MSVSYGNASSAGPIKSFGEELDKTAVISEEFKQRLWSLMMSSVDDAFKRGAESEKPKKRLKK